jgi:hypothetical protein
VFFIESEFKRRPFFWPFDFVLDSVVGADFSGSCWLISVCPHHFLLRSEGRRFDILPFSRFSLATSFLVYTAHTTKIPFPLAQPGACPGLLFDFLHCWFSSGGESHQHLPILVRAFAVLAGVREPSNFVLPQPSLWPMSPPSSEMVELKPLYMCPGCSNHTYSNSMVNKYNILINYKLESLQNFPSVQKKITE